MLTLLTTTGCRPEAFNLCQKYMLNQTYQGKVKWVIVDDGEIPQPINFKRDNWTLEIIRPQPYWRKGQNTQHRNFLAGLEVISDDEKVLIIEDDDIYLSGWLDKVVSEFELSGKELIGQSQNKYYNVVTGEITQHDNDKHSSLCSSAVRGEALKAFRHHTKQGWKLIDLMLWRHHNSKHLFKSDMVIGVKAMAGRAGIAGGHLVNQQNFKNSTYDNDDTLKSWVGDYADAYRQYRK